MEEILPKMITVFGGSRCNHDSQEYQEAVRLGRLLVAAGYRVCSGGYSGVMEAISLGAHESGGDVVGVTMTQFAATPNRYLKKIIPSADFYARLQTMILESAGYVALRGGMGTVTKAWLVWNKLMTGVLSGKPLILLGECWPRVISCLRECLVVSSDDIAHLSFAATAEEALQVLEMARPK